MPTTRRTFAVSAAAPLLLAACSSSSRPASHTISATVEGGRQTVRLVGTAGNAWSPNAVSAAAGDLTVTMLVPGGTPHDFQIEAVAGSKMGLISRGESRSLTVHLTPGTYRFVCTIHSGMDGKIVVTSPAPTTATPS